MIPLRELGVEQIDFLHQVADGESTLLNGPAGSGKTQVLDHLEAYLKQMGIRKKVYKTSSSGMSARILNGETTSRFLNLGIYTFPSHEIIRRNQICDIDPNGILIADEAYDFDHKRMSQIDLAMQTCTSSSATFGGMQTILSQDECQFMPLDTDPWSDGPYRDHFTEIEFTRNYRQEKDPAFLRMLTELREHIKADETIDLERWWNELGLEKAPKGTSDWLVLTPHFDGAKKINKGKQKVLAKNEVEITVRPHFSGTFPEEVYKEQRFSVGTPVIHELNRNDCVNGSLGVVEAIDFDSERILINFEEEGRIWIGRTKLCDFHSDAYVQYHPIRQAFALTARKTRGLTLQYGLVSREFANPETQIRGLYTALSRFTEKKAVMIH